MHAQSLPVQWRRAFAGRILRTAPLFVLLSFLLASPTFAAVRISVDSTSLDFGPVVLGGTVDRTLHITNTSSSDVQIDRFAFVGGAAGDYTVINPPASSMPVVVPAGASNAISVIVRFQPQMLGDRPAVMSIETSDGNLDMDLTGSGTGDQIALTFRLSSIDFGVIAPNATKDTTVWLVSEGTGTASVSGVQVSNSGTEAAFEAEPVNSLVTYPIIIPAGDSVLFRIRFLGVLPEEVKYGSVSALNNGLTLPSISLQGEVRWGSADFTLANIDFGQLYVGEVHDTIVDLQNTSDVPISVIDVQLNSLDFGLNPAEAMPIEIGAGESHTFHIRANPVAVGTAFAQLQTVSRTTQPTFHSVNITAEIQPMPLTLSPLDTLRGSCSEQGAITFSRSLHNSGSRDFTLTGIEAEDSGLVLTLPAMPATIRAGADISLDFSVVPNSVAARGYFVIDYMGGEEILLRDTIYVSLTSSLASTSVVMSPVSDWREQFTVHSSDALTTTPVSTLVIHLHSTDANHITIDKSSIQVAPQLQAANVDVQDEPGGYVVTLTSSAPMTLAADGVILTFAADEFVSQADTAKIETAVEAPEWSECLGFSPSSVAVGTSVTCGSDLLHQVLSTGAVTITGIQRVDKQHLRVTFNSSEALSATVSIVGTSGAGLHSQRIEIPRGRSMQSVVIDDVPVGAAFLQIRLATGPQLLAGFTK